MKWTGRLAAALVMGLMLCPPASARIKLVALPARERVEIQLDNGRYTLVEEERIVPLQKSTAAGNNKIDFSWSNTTIDKNSIQFRPIGIRDGDKVRPIRKVKRGGRAVDEIAVINVSYPPNENALVWEVFAAEGCAVRVRVSYLIRNLTRTFNYKAVANKTETRLLLRKYIQMRNYSGEDFGFDNVWIGYGSLLKFPRAVGQQEEIKMLLYRFTDVPVTKTYTFNWYAHGPLNKDKPFASRVLMHYVLKNDKANKLGVVPLEPGKVRIYIQDNRGGEAFLGEDWGRLTPIGGKMQLALGQARDIACKRMVEFKEVHPIRGDLADVRVTIRYEIENFKPDPVTLDIVEQMNRLAAQYGRRSHRNHNRTPHGDAEWKMGDRTSKEIMFSHEYGGHNPVLHVKLPARPKDDAKKVTKTVVRFQFTIKNVW